MKYKIGIVLSGGGARGIAHLGVLKALDEFGIKPSVISGTSAGAIVGAFYANDYSYEEILEIIKKGHFFNFSNILFKKQGLYSMKAFEEIYKQYFTHNSFERLKIPVFITATDILKGSVFYFSSGNLSKSLMASSCIPLLFQPVNYNDTLYVDGGVLNNFPIEPLLSECEFIIGSFVNSIQKETSEIHMHHIIDRCFHLAMRSSIENKISKFSLLIEPPNMSRFSIFDLKKADTVFEYGYNYALSMEKEIKALNLT